MHRAVECIPSCLVHMLQGNTWYDIMTERGFGDLLRAVLCMARTLGARLYEYNRAYKALRSARGIRRQLRCLRKEK